MSKEKPINYDVLSTAQIFHVVSGLMARYNEYFAYGYSDSVRTDVDNLTYDLNNGLLALAECYDNAAFIASVAINRGPLSIAEFSLYVLGEECDIAQRHELCNYVLRGKEKRLLDVPSGERNSLAAVWLACERA